MDVTLRLDNLQAKIEERYGEKISALRRDIHREPELGFDTEKTARKVLDALEGLPLEIEAGVAQSGPSWGRCSVIRVATKPGRTSSTATPRPCSLWRRPSSRRCSPPLAPP